MFKQIVSNTGKTKIQCFKYWVKLWQKFNAESLFSEVFIKSMSETFK